jgi:hypothetical protein
MASGHKIVGMYMGNRPIMTSNLNIAATYLPSGLNGIALLGEQAA